ncbi:MAG: hypothetical protein HQL44_05610 [Alphaproteobacteria bacterium]|nr:hypothetical protein [Alphaproteobacteria bacterium]
MFSKFKYESVPLKDILLDDRNPRLVTQKKLTTQDKIVEYLFDHEDLSVFLKKVAAEGKNHGAERPYIVKTGSKFTVIEGNTRIAAYKLLTGLLSAPKAYATSVPNVSQGVKDSMLDVDCSIAPSRDILMPIMARAHFGKGDKSSWGYLGSRKAIYDEWKANKSISVLAKTFEVTQGDIRDFILEYELYNQVLGMNWTNEEQEVLLDPNVKFNPPVRFLQTGGHSDLVGISYDRTNLKVLFSNAEAKKKLKHLILNLVINPKRGLGATASYDDVFKDYKTSAKSKDGAGSGKSSTKGTKQGGGKTSSSGKGGCSSKPMPQALFNYISSMNNGLVDQLMKEAKNLNCKNFPAAGTFLLRNIVEAILKHIIDQQKANSLGVELSLEGSLSLCKSDKVKLPNDDKKVLKEFEKSHLSYLNLGAHGNVIPNSDRLFGARDCIDQFVKRHV